MVFVFFCVQLYNDTQPDRVEAGNKENEGKAKMVSVWEFFSNDFSFVHPLEFRKCVLFFHFVSTDSKNRR